MKHRDEYANPGGDVLKEDKSVVSGHAVEDIEPGQPDPPIRLFDLSMPLPPGYAPNSSPKLNTASGPKTAVYASRFFYACVKIKYPQKST